ncbi:MAG TPA: hypothetical protein VF209_01885 [Patescibacteria group bacterium]
MTKEEAKRTIAIALHAFGKQDQPKLVISPEDGRVELRNVSFSSSVLSYTDDRASKNVQATKSGSQIDINFGSERGVLRFSYIVNGTVSTKEGSFSVASRDKGIEVDGRLYEVY